MVPYSELPIETNSPMASVGKSIMINQKSILATVHQKRYILISIALTPSHRSLEVSLRISFILTEGLYYSI